MALATLPYKFKITSFTADAANANWQVFFDILNNSNVVLASAYVWVGQSQTYSSIRESIVNVVYNQMESDAGSRSALLTALVGKNVST